MTGSRSAFAGAFAGGQGNIDKAREALSDLLDADTELATWMNGGRVIRSVLMIAPPGTVRPSILTAALSVRETSAPGNRAKYKLPIGILVSFEEFVREYEPGDVTAATLYEKIGGIVYGVTTVGSQTYRNPLLCVPRYGMRPLVEGIASFAPVNIAAAANKKPGATIEILFEVEYFMEADLFAPRAPRLPA